MEPITFRPFILVSELRISTDKTSFISHVSIMLSASDVAIRKDVFISLGAYLPERFDCGSNDQGLPEIHASLMARTICRQVSLSGQWV
jgi:hypothetical protein